MPLAEPYICSFCNHAGDNEYERNNGLLSQWRGYGGEGRFALVFDTSGLDRLLSCEWYAQYLVIHAVSEVYLNLCVIREI